jgi:hypothetical protein
MRAHTKGKNEMGKRFAIVIGVAAAGVMALGAQTAAAEVKTFKYTSEFKSVSTANGYPRPGGTAKLVGLPPRAGVKLKPGGDTGNLIDHLRITERLAPNKFAFKGKGIDNFGSRSDEENSGKLRRKFKGTTTVRADGSQKLAIEGHFTGGHVDFAPPVAGGRYHGASGHYKGSATVAPDSGVIVGSSKGKLRMQADAVADDPDQPAGVMAQTATSSTGPVDSTPPDLQLSGKKKQELGAVKVKVSCGDEACQADGGGNLNVAGRRSHWQPVGGSFKQALNSAPADLGPGETTTLELKPEKRPRKVAGKALDQGRNVRAKVIVEATDAAGNVATATRTIKLVK